MKFKCPLVSMKLYLVESFLWVCSMSHFQKRGYNAFWNISLFHVLVHVMNVDSKKFILTLLFMHCNMPWKRTKCQKISVGTLVPIETNVEDIHFSHLIQTHHGVYTSGPTTIIEPHIPWLVLRGVQESDLLKFIPLRVMALMLSSDRLLLRLCHLSLN